MVVFLIHRTLIDNGFGLNVCRINMPKEIKVDLSNIQPDNVHVCGFNNVSKKSLGIITLLIKLGPTILDTPIYVMPRPLNYNLILGIP